MFQICIYRHFTNPQNIIAQFSNVTAIMQAHNFAFDFNDFNDITGRSQKVKIGKTLSSSKNIESGVPQGGILSPIIFIIYGADLEDWLRQYIQQKLKLKVIANYYHCNHVNFVVVDSPLLSTPIFHFSFIKV